MAIDPTPYAGPLVITVAYTALYYVFQLRGMRVKIRLDREYTARGERFDRYFGQDREMLASDRTQLNMLEHMPMFVALLWLNAVFVGPLGATLAGAVYLASRCMYPFVMGTRLGSSIHGLVLAATIPGYLVIAYLSARLVLAIAGV